MKNTLRLAVLFVATACIAGYASADEINYGDFEGDTVTYVDVSEASLEDGALYGAPSVTGNSLSLPGTGFISESNNGEVDFLDGRLSFMIEADPNSTISSITIEEFGAYFTFGEDSIASVSAIAFVETLEGSLTSGDFSFSTTGVAGNQPNSGPWQQSLTISFPETTKITVTLDLSLIHI